MKYQDMHKLVNKKCRIVVRKNNFNAVSNLFVSKVSKDEVFCGHHRFKVADIINMEETK